MKLMKITVAFARMAFAIVIFAASPAPAEGMNGNGVEGRSTAMAGADPAWASDPMDTTGSNQARLAFPHAREAELGAQAGVPNVQFNKFNVASGPLDNSLHAFLEGAIVYRFEKIPVTVGLSAEPDSFLLADWHFPHNSQIPPGPADDRQFHCLALR